MLARSRRALVVEDEPLIAIMLEQMLEDLGWEVAATACSEQEALADLAADTPTIAILDFNLGSVTSLAIAARCAELHVPVVFTTGYSARYLPEECASAPILTKPFSLDELRGCLNRALSPS